MFLKKQTDGENKIFWLSLGKIDIGKNDSIFQIVVISYIEIDIIPKFVTCRKL